MAEKTIKQLEEELATAKAEADAAKAEADALREKVGPKDNTGKPIPGTFKVELEDTKTGKKEKLTLKFQPGYIRCRLQNGQAVMSEHLLLLANGKKLSEEQLAASPALAGMEPSEAADWLTHLARIRASFLVPA